jgi:hypothetical protein
VFIFITLQFLICKNRISFLPFGVGISNLTSPLDSHDFTLSAITTVMCHNHSIFENSVMKPRRLNPVN